MNAEWLIPIRELTLDQWAKIAVIAAALFAIYGACLSRKTLYLNFLRPSRLSLRVGKSALVVFHDNALQLAPMIDVFCTLVNNGARAGTVERLKGCLIHDASSNRMAFDDYGFLKNALGCITEQKQDEQGAQKNVLKWIGSWTLDEYSHPLLVGKYSEISKMVMFKGRGPALAFDAGSYTLTIEAEGDGKRLCWDTVRFDITPTKAGEIQKRKQNAQNESTEIPLK